MWIIGGGITCEIKFVDILHDIGYNFFSSYSSSLLSKIVISRLNFIDWCYNTINI